ncbi:AfsR/SARP family transcriptional regulator [Streptomyces sp. SID4985]|uniref:AfsR/SARP family transcriptional regulator n=1 Tax=unclassified Streptomyces TaxID=2593676 RepID=UPI001F440876|nr:AfsR/SARP family transcriptional regulator [Streptomyces sp. SID4985]
MRKAVVKTGLHAPDGALPERLAAAAHSGRPRFLVLGLLAITDGRETVVLQPSRPTSLLAALLLHPGAVVSAELLQRVVWGDRPPAGGRSALHTCVLRLRRLFTKYGVADGAVEAVPGGYRLHADADTLDLLQFRGLLGRASATEDPEQALRLGRAALRLWKGPLLGNVHSDELHRDHVPRLAEERLFAMERVFDVELRLGRHREMTAEAREAVRAEPGHEGLSALLIEALYRSGRRAEALAEYRRIHTHLTTELGVEPGPALRGLQLAVLRGEPSGQRPALPASGVPPSAPGEAPPGLGRASPPAPGDLVLRALVDAGLLEEDPPGRYRVHDLLRLFVQAAGTSLPATAASSAGASASAPPGPYDRHDPHGPYDRHDPYDPMDPP